MKKNLSTLSFEILFSLGIITILLLPPLVMAQQHKEFKVTIVNSDTTINGKNIKELSVKEHKKAIVEITIMEKGNP